MTFVPWKLNRLRAMSGPEVLHRVGRWIGLQAEKRLIAIGWQPFTKDPVQHKNSLFPDVKGWRDAWSTQFTLNHEKLKNLANNKIDLLSYESLRIDKPVNWHRDPLTGQESPIVFGKTLNYRDDKQVGDVKVLWELGRHQHLISLAVAYACSGNISYRDSVIEQIDGWIDANPFGLGIHWNSSLECGLRLISWAVVHSLLILRDQHQGLFSAVSDRDRFGQAIYQHAWFIRHNLSRYSSANNHLIGELSGLWVTSQVFDLGSAGKKWGQFAKRELEQQVQAQVYSDGVDKEQAIYYHLWVLEYLLVIWLVGERNGQPFSQNLKERILLMSEFLHDISLNSGGPPQIGDADDGFVTRFEPSWPSDPYNEIQIAVDTIFNNGRPATSRNLPQKAFWYALIAGILPRSPHDSPHDNEKNYPILYKEGGYAILGDEHFHLVFDAGPLGYPSIAAHAHADALSFCLALDDEWWLIDPGTYAYHRETEWRNYFRGTSAHNTVVINGQNQSKIGGAFLWLDRAHAAIESIGKKNDGTQFVSGVHDGYRFIEITHRRRITYAASTGIVEITDFFGQGNSTGPLQISIYFHFAPDIELTIRDLNCIATMPGRDKRLQFHLDHEYQWEIVKGRVDPIDGWYSPRLGSKIPAAVLIGNRLGSPERHLKTRIEICSATSSCTEN